MENTQGSTEYLTREFMEAAEKLNPEEKRFFIELMQLIDADPETGEDLADAAELEASGYNLRKAEGRAAFLEHLRALQAARKAQQEECTHTLAEGLPEFTGKPAQAIYNTVLHWIEQNKLESDFSHWVSKQDRITEGPAEMYALMLRYYTQKTRTEATVDPLPF